MRRLFAQASSSATATAVEQPLNINTSNYDQKSSTSRGTPWSPQLAHQANGNGRTMQTPSPPPSKSSNINRSNSPASSSGTPVRQNSNPFHLDDVAPSRSASRSVKRKPSASGHSKASSSLSRSIAYTNGSPPLPGGAPAVSVNSKDELIIELLASEAIVDSRECEILGSEQVEQLKKVCTHVIPLYDIAIYGSPAPEGHLLTFPPFPHSGTQITLNPFNSGLEESHARDQNARRCTFIEQAKRHQRKWGRKRQHGNTRPSQPQSTIRSIRTSKAPRTNRRNPETPPRTPYRRTLLFPLTARVYPQTRSQPQRNGCFWENDSSEQRVPGRRRRWFQWRHISHIRGDKYVHVGSREIRRGAFLRRSC